MIGSLSSYAYAFYGASNTFIPALPQTSPLHVSSHSLCVGFRRTVVSPSFTIQRRQTLGLLSSSSSSDPKDSMESINKQVLTKRRRVRRKDDEGEGSKPMDDDKEEDTEELMGLGSTDGLEMVEVKIRNIRDESTRSAMMTSMGKSSEGRADNNGLLDTETVVGRKDGDGPRSMTINRDSTDLESLLADAKRMRAERGGSSSTNSDESAGDKIINFLSVVVTFDFFIVCGLLLWFLAGVFASYVLKNDTVQIAFNGIFQPVVQPALGILMIGSAASAILKGKGDDDSNSDKKK